jgi:hypothetical protein
MRGSRIRSVLWLTGPIAFYASVSPVGNHRNRLRDQHSVEVGDQALALPW